MQSLFQYRRFEKHVARQYERDKAKAEALANPDSLGLTSSSSSHAVNAPEAIDARNHVDTRDLEKCEQATASPLGAGEHARMYGSEKEEEAGEGYAPVQAEPRGNITSRDAQASEDMSRTMTAATRNVTGTAMGKTLTGIDVRDRSTKEGGNGKVFVVGYEGKNDIMDPHNWSLSTRFAAT